MRKPKQNLFPVCAGMLLSLLLFQFIKEGSATPVRIVIAFVALAVVALAMTFDTNPSTSLTPLQVTAYSTTMIATTLLAIALSLHYV